MRSNVCRSAAGGIIFFAVMALSNPPFLQAQQAAEPPQLTLQQAVTIALEKPRTQSSARRYKSCFR